MKRQISISIFLACLVIVLTLLYIKLTNESKQEENRQSSEQLVQQKMPKEQESETPKSITISQEYENAPFYIRAEDGWLVVYYSNTKVWYMDTGIAAAALPLELQAQLDSGIFFQSENELYDFLESYSS